MTRRDLVYSITWGNLVYDSERPSGIQYDLGKPGIQYDLGKPVHYSERPGIQYDLGKPGI